MKSLGSQFPKGASRLARQERHNQALRYVSAVTLVAAALLARFVLQPVFGASQVYTLFYPVVLLAAYGLGARPALLAMVLSAAVGYWCLAQPPYQFKASASVAASLGLFLATSTIGVYLITGLIAALRDLARRQAQAEMLAAGHAERFQDLSDRMSNHLQLISGLLALQAKAEPDPAIANALDRAAARASDITRIHREFPQTAAERVDFKAFLTTLVRPLDMSVEVSGADLTMPRQTATVLGVAVLETLTILSEPGRLGAIRLELGIDGGNVRLGFSRPDASEPVGDARPLQAVVEQMGGRLTARDRTLELSFPRPAPAALSHSDRISATLH